MTVETGSASVAALNLFRTQSAITRLIRDLEHILNVPLFERHARGMMLTDIGSVIFPRAKSALEELNQIPYILSRLQPKYGRATELKEPSWLYNENRLLIFLGLHKKHYTLHVANDLNITQPAVSAAVKVMEKGASTPLFYRTPKGMVPTPASNEIAPFISRALNSIKRIPEDIEAYQGNITGTIYVGALPLSRAWILPEAIIELMSKNRNVKVATNESDFSNLLAGLSSGEIDFIIGALRSEESFPEIKTEILFEEELILLARPNHPLTDKHVGFKDLKDTQWILSRNNAPSRHLLNTEFKKIGLSAPKPTVESGDLAVVRGLLLRSDMVAVVSSHQLDYEVSQGILVPLRVKLGGTKRGIGLMTRHNSIPTPAANALASCIRQVVRNT